MPALPPAISLPHQWQVEAELLCLLEGRTRPTETAHVYSELAAVFRLSGQQKHAARPRTKGSAWEYLVRQAKRHLKDQGLLHCPQTGLWILTASGQQEAKKHKLAKTVTAESLGL